MTVPSVSVAYGDGSPRDLARDAVTILQGVDPNPNHLRGPAGSATPMSYNVKSRYRAAAHHAKRVWPGPVGELVSRELLAVEDFGYLGSHPASEALVADVLAREVAR